MFDDKQVKVPLPWYFWERVYQKHESHSMAIQLFRLLGELVQEKENRVK